MSPTQETRIEITGNIQVHHPVIESIRERDPHPVHIPEHLRGVVTVREPVKP